MLLTESIQGYILDSQVANKTDSTICNIRLQTSYFVKWKGDCEISTITALDLKNYLRFQQQRGKSAQTVYSACKHVKTFFRWCAREGLIAADPSAALPTPKLPEQLPRVLAPEQVTQLIAQLRRDASALGHRNITIFLTLLDTGVRANELVHINVGDVFIENSYLLVLKGKGQKQRAVPLSPTLRRELWRYLHQWRPKLNPTVDQLFPNVEGRELTTDGLQQMVREKLAGIGVKGGPHLLRHTCATLYLRNGGDLERLRLILGHTTLEITQRYIHLLPEDLIRRHAEVSPLESVLK